MLKEIKLAQHSPGAKINKKKYYANMYVNLLEWATHEPLLATTS